MKLKNTILLSTIILSITSCSKTTSSLKPDNYTKEGYCIVNTPTQMATGLNRFNTKEEFIKECNGKMIFKFGKQVCRVFTMKDMKFDILIENDTNRYNFKVGEEMTICGKDIIESVPVLTRH